MSAPAVTTALAVSAQGHLASVASASVPSALDTDQAGTIAILVIVGILFIGALISFVITAIVWRVVVVVVVLVVAGVVYGQRQSIESSAKSCDATFFGIHLTPDNPTVKKQCQQISK